MKPTSEKVQRVLTQARAELSSNTRAESLWRTIEQLASDELQRRQQPAPAKDVSSVPAELIEQWWAAATIKSGGIYSVMSNCQYIADKALAYGREQAQYSSALRTAEKALFFHVYGDVLSSLNLLKSAISDRDAEAAYRVISELESKLIP